MKKMTVYKPSEGDEKDPRWYENRADMHDLDNCTIWTMHMEVHEVEEDDYLQAISEIPEGTGEYLYGGSWELWGQKTDEPEQHMAFYFRANGANVHMTHQAIRDLIEAKLGRKINTTIVSTAGDWALQSGRIENKEVTP